MKNVKVRIRMLLSFLLILVFSFAVIAVALVEANNIRGSYERILAGPVSVTDSVQESQREVNSIARQLRDMALFGYDTQTVNEIEDSIAVIDSALDNIRAQSGTGNSLAQQYITAVEAWEDVFSDIDSALRQNNLDQARTLLENQCTPALNAAVAAGNALSAQVQEEGDVTVAQVQAALTRNMVVTIVLAAVLFVVGLLLNLRMIRDIVRPLQEASDAVKALSQGELDREVDYQSRNEIGAVCDAVRKTQKILNGIIYDISMVTEALHNGDLTADVREEYPGQYAPIKKNLEGLLDQLNSTMTDILQASDQVAAGADQVSTGAQALAQGATEQASAVEELSATINELDNSAQANAEAARTAKAKADQAAGQVQISSENMREMRQAMDDIMTGQEDISKIIATIENIAFQTNILALNAAVEAARAGTAGKGFAVVADEVRNLASKSDQAAKQTKELIERSMQNVERGGALVEQVDGNMQKTVEYASDAIAHMDMVAENSIAEADSIAQLSTGVDQISAVVQTNSATSEESAAASEQLSSQAVVMKQLIQRFKVRSSTPRQQEIPEAAETAPGKPEPAPAWTGENRFSKY